MKNKKGKSSQHIVNALFISISKKSFCFSTFHLECCFKILCISYILLYDMFIELLKYHSQSKDVENNVAVKLGQQIWMIVRCMRLMDCEQYILLIELHTVVGLEWMMNFVLLSLRAFPLFQTTLFKFPQDC